MHLGEKNDSFTTLWWDKSRSSDCSNVKNDVDSCSQGADGVGSGSGSTGQRIPTCCQTGRQEAEGVRCGEKSQCCNHVSGVLLFMSVLMSVPKWENIHRQIFVRAVYFVQLSRISWIWQACLINESWCDQIMKVVVKCHLFIHWCGSLVTSHDQKNENIESNKCCKPTCRVEPRNFKCW